MANGRPVKTSDERGPDAARPWTRHLDLVACGALLVAACLAYVTLPDGSVLRFVLGSSLVLFVPGYLLIEAVAGPSSQGSRMVRPLLAIGVSPALVGLLALASAFLPGGFRADPIAILLAAVSFGLAGAAFLRRRLGARSRSAAGVGSALPPSDPAGA